MSKTMVQTIENTTDSGRTSVKSKAEQLREVKALLDEGILTQEEFEEEKKRILSGKH